MLESGVVIGLDGNPIFWHSPISRSLSYLPDSPQLWTVLFEHRNNLLGFAHSHPGSGWPSPSHTDITTFQAIETGLGISLNWWITSADRLMLVRMTSLVPINYHVTAYEEASFLVTPWLDELRRRSYINPLQDPNAVCNGRYIDFQGADRQCTPYEGCALPQCLLVK